MDLSFLDFFERARSRSSRARRSKKLPAIRRGQRFRRQHQRARSHGSRPRAARSRARSSPSNRHAPQDRAARSPSAAAVHASITSKRIFTDFQESCTGDRHFRDDPRTSSPASLRLEGRPVDDHRTKQKGRDTKQKVHRNSRGWPSPTGYRKALRLAAARGAYLPASPVLTFIDTPGAYPGIGAEERGQSEAIARKICWSGMSRLKVPDHRHRDRRGRLRRRARDRVSAIAW